MRLLIANVYVLILFLFLLSCAPKAEKGISDVELFGTEDGISDEELFGPEDPVTGGVISSEKGDEYIFCKTATVSSCAIDSSGIIHITKGKRADTRVVSCNSDASAQFKYQCLNLNTIERCWAACSSGEQCVEAQGCIVE